jgi:serine/threonine protein phosphatase PrpC
MHFISAVHTDKGIKKEVNQDAMLLKIANTEKGRVAFGVICDGMGGLEQGEVASGALVRSMANWFDRRLPDFLRQGLTVELLRREWSAIVGERNARIQAYGQNRGIQLGTTMVALLLVEGTYYIVNVGDSRVYLLCQQNQIRCLTRDQTVIQRDLDAGRITYEEAINSPQRNVLLQCIGASPTVIPDYYTGEFQEDTMFLLCSDGFRHMVSEE